MSSALVVAPSGPAGPRSEDELTGLPYIDAISPEEKATVDGMLQQEVSCALLFYTSRDVCSNCRHGL